MKRKSIYFVILFVIFFSLGIFLANYGVQGKFFFDAKGFIGDKLETLKHSKMEYSVYFIGDSRTKFHFDPQIFSQHGVNAYNTGIGGFFYPNWAPLIEKIPNKKIIVFGFNVNDFYGPFSERNLNLYATLPSLRFLYKNADSYYLLQYIKFALNNVSPPLQRLHAWLGNSSVPFDRFKTNRCILNGTTSTHRQYICDDGSGYLESITYPNLPTRKINLATDTINHGIVNYINDLIAYANSKQIKVVIILSPRYGAQYQFDYAHLSQLIQCPILNLSDFLIDKSQYWEGSGAHLNVQGRELISQKVFQWLDKQYLKDI